MFSFWFVRTETSFFTRSHNYLMSSNSLNWFPNLINFLFWPMFSFFSSSIMSLRTFIYWRSRLDYTICGSRTSVHISLTSVKLIKLWIFSSITSKLLTYKKRYFIASWSRYTGSLSSSTNFLLFASFKLLESSSLTAMMLIFVFECTLAPPPKSSAFIVLSSTFRLYVD